MADFRFIQVALSPVFLVSLEEELTVLVRPPLVTCADLVACSHQQRSGESGTKRLTLVKSMAQLSDIEDILTKIRRFATVSALAASSVPALLLARGHQVSTVPEVPLVINSEVFAGAAIARTSAALGLLKSVGAGADM